MEQENQYYTPLYKIFFIISFILLFVFLILFSLVKNKNETLLNSYKLLEKEGRTTFSVLVDQHSIKDGKKKRFIYTYLVPDNYGRMNEVVEIVDQQINKKLRVGDTVLTQSMTIQLFGRSVLISKIVGNLEKRTIDDFLYKLSAFGILYSLVIGLIAIFYKLTGK
ncbi:MAG: hypothetical protein H7A23_09480 [Leptospiraceae bacterium]|nr:hypothetical protein [Leptospiraceae bacterium]MCP5494774.1 hypothetical protein [Leptospiraceae bacterium]